MSSVLPDPPACVLFDLDGTLVDTARDLYRALVALCAEEGVAEPRFEKVRARVSQGSRAILGAAFVDDDDAALLARVPRYLEIYSAMLDGNSVFFPGIEGVLDALEARGIPWGVVTNKPGFLAQPLLDRLGLAPRMAAFVAGDSLPTRKPDPETLLHAAATVGVAPAACIYVGDDERDAIAARRAGMPVIAVRWGYLGDIDPDQWDTDGVVDDAAGLARVLGLP